jgi:hypothetical protein
MTKPNINQLLEKARDLTSIESYFFKPQDIITCTEISTTANDHEIVS